MKSVMSTSEGRYISVFVMMIKIHRHGQSESDDRNRMRKENRARRHLASPREDRQVAWGLRER